MRFSAGCAEDTLFRAVIRSALMIAGHFDSGDTLKFKQVWCQVLCCVRTLDLYVQDLQQESSMRLCVID